MAKLPSFSGPEVVRRLKRLELVEHHCRGSHVYLMNQAGALTSVPCHGSTPVKKGTLSAILRQAGVSREQFLDA